jgi:zinc protease
LATLLVRPTFAADAFERERRKALVALRQAEQDPGSVGMKALYRQIYGGHPYSSDPLGTEASLEALTPEGLRAYHQRYYVAANAVVAMVGDLGREQAAALAERLVGALPTGSHAEPVPAVPALSQGITKRLEFPSTQTHVYAGQPGMQRVDPDYFPLYVGNHILGGSGLVSLLSDEVREKRGLSYSVYSHFLPMSALGPFVLGLQTKNSQATEAQRVLLETLSQFAAEGPSDEELRAAKLNLTGGFPLRIASNAKILQNLAAIGFYRLPHDYLDRFNERVEAVTAAQIRDAFQRRIDPARLAVVIVGPQQEGRVAQALD